MHLRDKSKKKGLKYGKTKDSARCPGSTCNSSNSCASSNPTNAGHANHGRSASSGEGDGQKSGDWRDPPVARLGLYLALVQEADEGYNHSPRELNGELLTPTGIDHTKERGRGAG